MLTAYASNPENFRQLTAVIAELIDRIEQLAPPVYERLEIENFLVTTEYDAPSLISDLDQMYLTYLRKIFASGFGACVEKRIVNIVSTDEYTNVVVINFANLKVGITDAELTALVAHELGHVFNKQPLQQVPTDMDVILKKATRAEQQRIRKENLLLNELHADSFAESLGYRNELISSLQKFVASTLATNQEQIAIRINNLMATR